MGGVFDFFRRFGRSASVQDGRQGGRKGGTPLSVSRPRRDIDLTFSMRDVDFAEVAEVERRAPLVDRDAATTRRVYHNSDLTCFAYHGSRLVGVARALSDHMSQAAIYDMCVLPEYQGQGVGALILRGMLERLPGQTVMLFAAPGKEGFYKHAGFRRMTTAMARFKDPARMIKLGYGADD